MQPHTQQPTRLPCPWDSLGKNTGVGCHFLLQCMKVKSESEVAQLCPTLSDPMDHSLPGSSVHGIFQARVLEWVAIGICLQSAIVNPNNSHEGKIALIFFPNLPASHPSLFSFESNFNGSSPFWKPLSGYLTARNWAAGTK